MGTIIEAPWSLGEGRKGGSSRQHLVEAEPQADQEPSSRAGRWLWQSRYPGCEGSTRPRCG